MQDKKDGDNMLIAFHIFIVRYRILIENLNQSLRSDIVQAADPETVGILVRCLARTLRSWREGLSNSEEEKALKFFKQT